MHPSQCQRAAAPVRALECSSSGRVLPVARFCPRARFARAVQPRGARLVVKSNAGKAAASTEQGGDDLVELERQLSAAIQLEDFTKAAKIRDLISNAKEDDQILAKYANSKFYKAFETRSYPEMQKIWGHGEHVSCLHPGSDCIAGRDQVLASWSQMFDGPGKMKVRVEDVRVHCAGPMAFVTCVELVDAGETTGRLTATNVFEKQNGGSSYSLIHHHACPTN